MVGWSRRVPGGPGGRPGGRVALAVLCAVLLLASCATSLAPPAGPQPWTQAYATDVIDTGYRYIADRYIEPVSLRRFAVTGLEGLKSVDPGLTVSESERFVDLSVAGARFAHLPAPKDDDAGGWAGLTVAAIDVARAYSAKLGAAESEVLFGTLFEAALGRLDTFSKYAGAERARNARAQRVGFGGIGVSIRMDESEARVVEVIADTPAAEAGIVPDDRVVAVEGRPVAGWTQQTLVDALRGEPGAPVALTIRRNGQADSQFRLVRRKIVPKTVHVEQRGPLPVVQVTSFNQRTAETLAEQVRALRREQGAAMRGLVLDLRGNPGGLLDQAVELVDVFLDDGEIVATKGRHPRSQQRFTATSGDALGGLPLVVLVNGGSASASEVVAAALQDRGRGVVVGTNSFGKGTVQTVFRLPNDGELTVTWSRLHAPSGYRLDGLGVLPTVCTHGGGQTPVSDDLLSALRGGTAGAPAEVVRQWHAVTGVLPTDRDRLRSACPADAAAPQADLEVANALVGDPALYARTLRHAQVPRPADPRP
ncbi:MAG: PDZ domain-containing protein [Alphaproteobacteria bacterium]|nr:PDZ domain-containing protein [Alphaproteobacteria bacterium]